MHSFLFADGFSLPSSLYRDAQPGVAMFHQYEDCNFTTFADQRTILHTLIQVCYSECNCQFIKYIYYYVSTCMCHVTAG